MNINMTEYHAAIKTWLEKHEQLSTWFNFIDRYPEENTKLPSPFLLFSVGDWDKDGDQPNSGQKAWNLSLTFHVGLNSLDSDQANITGADYQIRLRDLAMAVCTHIDEARFDLSGSVGSLVVSSCEYDALATELDEYIVYAISASQLFLTSRNHESLDAQEFVTGGTSKAGYSPNIGEAHEADYETIYNETGE